MVTYRYPVPYVAADYYISPQVESLFGYPPEAWAEQGFWESRLHPEDRDRSFGASEHSIDVDKLLLDNANLAWNGIDSAVIVRT